MTKGSRDPGKPYYPVGSRVPRTYLLACLLSYLLTYLDLARARQKEKEREREGRGMAGSSREQTFSDTPSLPRFSRRTNLDQGKSLLGDARILGISTEPGEYSKWPSESQNPANKGRSPRTFEKPRASSTSSLCLSLSRFSSSLPALPSLSFPCRLSTCWRHKSWPGPVVRTERSVCRCLDRRISRLWRPVSLLTPSFYLRFYGFFRKKEREREPSSLDSLPPSPSSFLSIGNRAREIPEYRKISRVDSVAKKFEELSLEFSCWSRDGGKCYGWNFARRINLNDEFWTFYSEICHRDRSSIHFSIIFVTNICTRLGRKEIHACSFFFFLFSRDNRDMSVWCVELRQRAETLSPISPRKKRNNVARQERSGSRERVADPSILRLIGS